MDLEHLISANLARLYSVHICFANIYCLILRFVCSVVTIKKTPA